MKITWPEFKLPPINLLVLPCALWFYNREEYNKLKGITNLNKLEK